MKMSKKEVLELVKIINERITNLTINKKINVENIGRIFNNKLNELNRYYEKRNQSFYEESFVATSILEYFCLLINEGKNKLVSYCMTREEEHLKKYRELCNLIFEFDIEKDLIVALKSCIIEDYYKGKAYYKLDAQTRQNYNEELQNLGSSKTIESLLVEVKMEQGLEELKIYHHKSPKIALSLYHRLAYYINKMTLACQNLDLVNMQYYSEKINNFEIATELENSLVYVFIEVLKVEDLKTNLEWQEIKEELVLLGQDDLIPQLETRIGEGLKRKMIKN